MGKVYHMIHKGWIRLDIYVHTFAPQLDTHTIWQDKELIWPCDIVWIYVDIPGYCKYVQIVMNNACRYVTKIFDKSMNALNVSFYIMRVILFCHLIILSCRLYMYQDQIFQGRDVFVYLDVTGKNIICMIRQTLTTFTKPGTYGE